jgi:hypothetical protein
VWIFQQHRKLSVRPRSIFQLINAFLSFLFFFVVDVCILYFMCEFVYIQLNDECKSK